jgi:hypothetical protein
MGGVVTPFSLRFLTDQSKTRHSTVTLSLHAFPVLRIKQSLSFLLEFSSALISSAPRNAHWPFFRPLPGS